MAQPVYASRPPDVTVFVERMDGDEVNVTEQAVFLVEPTDLASITADNRLVFNGTGTGLLTACYSNLCDQSAFIVNDGKPVLTVIEPPFGAFLLGSAEEGIRVLGTVEDSDEVQVTVNGASVPAQQDGTPRPL